MLGYLQPAVLRCLEWGGCLRAEHARGDHFLSSALPQLRSRHQQKKHDMNVSRLLVLLGLASATSAPPAVSELQFYAVRHGQSEANVAHLISSDPDYATKTHGLTTLGSALAYRRGRTQSGISFEDVGGAIGSCGGGYSGACTQRLSAQQRFALQPCKEPAGSATLSAQASSRRAMQGRTW